MASVAGRPLFRHAAVFLLIFLPIGLAAGVLNVMRLGNSKQAKTWWGESQEFRRPSVQDEDED